MRSKNFAKTLHNAIVGFVGSWKFLFIQLGLFLSWFLVNKTSLFDLDSYTAGSLFMSFQTVCMISLILKTNNIASQNEKKASQQAFELNKETNSHLEVLFEQIEISTKELQDLKRLIRSLKN